ncbi:LPS assembly protein LptD [Nitrosospira multiformis]|uniref:LPS-assembly protein LptD n=1 Tax=Nitrosospira multiformis TaxID=1231 RepID=A0A1I7FBD2_9PROT|nr:LPS assembly protein LptD [Nitrosospira multiformis]SFU33461.1 LPS-assembly protein [Nitrosospira multiformis]
MKLRFIRSVCWSFLLFCLAWNVRAEPPLSSRPEQERAAPPGEGDDKPVVIDTERIRGHHEYESGARNESELRSRSTISTDQIKKPNQKASPTAKDAPSGPQQNYTLSPAIKTGSRTSTSAQESEKTESMVLPSGMERLPEPVAEEGEPRLRTTTRAAPRSLSAEKRGEKSVRAAAAAEADEGRPGFAEGERIGGHREEAGEARLRLAGEAEPEGVEQKLAEVEAETDKQPPVFVVADRLQGHVEQEIEAIGKAELSTGDQFISAERMKYNQSTNDAEAQGNVRVEKEGDILEGSNLKFNLLSKTGQLSEPNYRLKDASSRGYAGMLLFEGENQYRLQKANYTTCPAGDDSWVLQVADLKLDNDKKVGTAKNVKLTFKDVPIMYTPWMNFSYSGERKSGLLAPTYSTSGRTGLELALPFYWNIAPNYDATFSARMMSKRGLAINNEFRFLGRNSSSSLLADIVPRDLDTETTRWRTSFWHNHYLGAGFSARLDYNRVSDDAYFRHFGNNLNLTSRTNLLQQGLLSYNRGLGDDGTFNVTSLVQSFQTIQDPLAAIVVPYKRLPQVGLNANKPDVLGTGVDVNLLGSWTNFSHPTLVSGRRIVLFPSMSYPLRNSFGFITPKVGMHYTRYSLGEDAGSPDETPTRTLPIFSLDSGIAFDRKTSLGGESFTQTLEPRIFYVYVPFRAQDQLPNFDSAKTDFSFAQMLSENRFSGSDRINDANQVTFALTTRLLESSTGRERLRVAVGHQLSFIDRRISLDTPQTVDRRPDFIAAVSGFLTPTISTDTSLQFDQTRLLADVVRSGVSYRPEPGRVLNFGYRFTRDVLHQVDASSQWRWSERWQTVARLNYSLLDHRILEGLAGVEYNACCWSLRFVLQHLTLATQKSTTAAFLQLELNGLMQIGSNPLTVLQRSIPGYIRTGSQGSSLIEGP